MSRADEFRKNADECRQHAAKAFNPLDKERWLKIAEHWLLMAQEADAAPITVGRRCNRESLKEPDACKFFCLPMKSPRSMTFDLGIECRI
jgi:hypothetical protein